MASNVENIFFKAIQKYSLLIKEEDYQKYEDSDVITYISVSGNTHTIPKELIYDLLDNDEYYEYFHRMINTTYYNLKIVCIGENRVIKEVSISIADAIRILQQKTALTEEQQKKLHALEILCSKDSLVKNSLGKKYSFILEDETITLEEADLLKVFLSGPKDFKAYTEAEVLFGVEKRKFFYALNRFLTENKITRKYILPNSLIYRNIKLKVYYYVDFESFNINKVAVESEYRASINPTLKEKIYKEMPKNYNDLQKAIYVYIALCKLFSYDYSFFISNDKERYGKKHKNIDRINELKSGNDTIVCYEFNAIYSKFLEELNIKHHVNSNNKGYGQGHTNIMFKKDEYIVFVDAVTSILSGDLINAKLNLPLNGINCMNLNSNTKSKFENIRSDIYKDVEDKYNHDIDLTEILRIKKRASENSLSFSERVNLLLSQITGSKLKIMDTIGYLTKLKRIIFSETELKKNISVVVVKENNHGVDKPVVIVCVNENGDINKSKNIYYKHDLKNEAIEVTKESLEKDFKSSKLEYIDPYTRTIPQINIKKKGDR